MATPAETTSIGGIVLCGGYSRRMGAPKAWLQFGSEYLLQHMVRIVSAVVQPVVVAGRPDQDLPPLSDDVAVVHDRVADCGPLAGMDAGFTELAHRCTAAFITSCDHPLLKPSVILRMTRWLEDYPAVVLSHEGRLYPLTGVYRFTVHGLLRQCLSDRKLRVRELARACGARIVPASELHDIDPDLASLRNVNDPDTLERLRRDVDSRPS
jgi:molybdopterin-guanine dinucleotide biosynthesis protein A